MAQPLEGILERSAAERGDADWIVKLDSIIRPQLDPNSRIATDRGDSVVESEELVRSQPHLFLVEEAKGMTRAPKNEPRRA